LPVAPGLDHQRLVSARERDAAVSTAVGYRVGTRVCVVSAAVVSSLADHPGHPERLQTLPSPCFPNRTNCTASAVLVFASTAFPSRHSRQLTRAYPGFFVPGRHPGRALPGASRPTQWNPVINRLPL